MTRSTSQVGTGETFIAVVWCCVHREWRLNEPIGADRVSLDDAAVAAEDDICHRGDVAAVVDEADRKVASVYGTITDQAHAQGALALLNERSAA